MSYAERLQQYRDASNFHRQSLPPMVSSLAPIPRDTTQALYRDKTNEYRDKMAEQLTAPFTTVGSVDLLRRGINKIPAVQDIRDMMKQGGEFANKIRNFVGSKDVQDFVQDPEGYIRGLGSDARESLVGMINDGVADARSTLQNAVGDGVGDTIQTLGRSIPTTEDAIKLGEEAGRRIAQATAEGARAGILGTAQPPASDAPAEAGGTENETAEERDTRELQEAFDAHEAAQANPQPAGGDVQPEVVKQAPDIEPVAPETEQFFDAATGDSVAEMSAARRAARRAEIDGLKASISDKLEAAGQSQKDLSGVADALMNARGDVGKTIETTEGPVRTLPEGASAAGGGDLLDLQKSLSPSDPRYVRGSTVDPEAEMVAKTKGDELTADRLGEASAEAAEKAGAEAGADGMSKVLGDVGGEVAGGEEAAALGVADAIPVVGTLADIGSIGAIVGEAVDYYKNKKKEEADAAALAARQSAIEKDIATEQSEIVGQARESAEQSAMQTAALEAQKTGTGIPVAQTGAEPTA